MRLRADHTEVVSHPHRYRLSRAGVLNVWQYDEQIFEFCGGRMLLRGANGAGKSKTLEMLLPFVLDGDKARMTASARHHTSLLWLMQEGASGSGTRTGYLWVEFARTDAAGARHVLTCGIGVRHSASAKTAYPWFFTVPGAIGEALELAEADGIPLSLPRCREVVTAAGGHFFDKPRPYKEHVGGLLFGLDPQRYDDLLRLLYWLRQPQIGEDIEPARLAQILEVALPELDDDAVRAVGESLDELAAHGEQLERLTRAAEAASAAGAIYERYARGELRARALHVLDAERERAARARVAGEAARHLQSVNSALLTASEARAAAGRGLDEAAAEVTALESGPLARSQAVLQEKQRRAKETDSAAASAGRRAKAAQQRAEGSRDRVEVDQQRLDDAVQRIEDLARAASAGLLACAVEAALALPDLRAETAHAAGQLAEHAQAGRGQVSRLQAAVTVVRTALREAEEAGRRRAVADQRAAEAERREEQAAGRLEDAQREAQGAERKLVTVLRAWEADPRGPGAPADPPLVTLPLEAASLDALPGRARAAADPALARARAQEADAAGRRRVADLRLAELERSRTRVLAERDPAPPPPALPRPSRRDTAGLPLWRLVDFRPGIDKAPLEAALEASGLLDALVRADGSVLGSDDLDTLLTAGSPSPNTGVGAPTLADALRVDLPEGSEVPTQAVEAVLRRVQLVDRVEGTDGAAAVGRDGSFRLGPLVGRATKPAAQYVGAAARVAERARRLDEVERDLAQTRAARQQAAAAEQAAAARRADLDQWLAALPPSGELRTAWTRVTERERELERTAGETRARAGEAVSAAEQATRARSALRSLATAHRLPEQSDALDARGAELRALDRSLERLATDSRSLVTAAVRLEQDREQAEEDESSAADALADADEAARLARVATTEAQALLNTLGADVQRMQQELDHARARQDDARVEAARAMEAVEQLTGERGEARATATATADRLAEAEPAVLARTRALLGLTQGPGLLEAALGRPLTDDEAAGVGAARAMEGTLRGDAATVVRAWAGLAVSETAVDANRVYAEVRTLTAGAAAESEPRVLEVEGALVLLARDETGAELPLREVAARLAATVLRERELLTERERTLFEEHLLGELGDKLRSRRAEAADLVAGMNGLLEHVRTSQGIRVRLDWELREDAGQDVHEAVALLGRPLGALLPEERSRLRESLHALIEVQRAAEPERGYAEHLAQALDYRKWSAFRVRIARPETTGWSTLSRRTPLSQGEQKVVCYLPLFAAAAAHFTSVAGAAPHAPRLVLLDDAFPKIDVRTHPLLFGLLVDLDLDFVITSERLWGDCDTVPSLAIYEALRSPTERGIAQYRYVWDGSRLTTEGGR